MKLYRIFYKGKNDPPTAKSKKMEELPAVDFSKIFEIAKKKAKASSMRVVMIAELPAVLKNGKWVK